MLVKERTTSMHSCEGVQRGAGCQGTWGVVTIPPSQQCLLEMHRMQLAQGAVA